MSCQPVQGSKRPHHTYTKQLQNSIMSTRRKQKNTNLKWSKQSSVWEYVKLKKYGEPRYKIHDAVLKYNDSTSLLMYRVKSTHPSMRSGMQQSTIPAVLARRKNTWDEARMEGITQRICKMVAKDMPPTSTVHILAEKLNGAIESWGLTGRACVHNRARNIVSANCPSRCQLGIGSMFHAYSATSR